MLNTQKVNDIGMFIKFSILVLIALFFVFAESLNAQQMQIDDAAVTTHRSFQIETWRGDFETIFQPAVGVTSNLELSTGLFFDTKSDFSFAGWSLEAKYVHMDLDDAGSAWGLVAGSFFSDEASIEEIFVYVPYSRFILGGSSVLHFNAGLAFSELNDGTHTDFIYGVRGDFGVHDRLSLLSEVFAVGSDFGYQAGVRFGIIPDLLELDVTYGHDFSRRNTFPGFTVGIAFTPDRLW